MALLSYIEQIAVTDQDARRQALLRQLEHLGCSFRLQRAELEGRHLQNVIVPFGKGTPGLVVGAHYDSVPGSTGANDDGSGVAILLDLVTTLLSRTSLAPLQVVFFDLEEVGRLGSRAYLRQVSPGDIRAMIYLDVCGVGDTILIAPQNSLAQKLLGSIVAATLRAGVHRLRVMESLPPGDETSFIQAGISSITVGIVPREDIELLGTSMSGQRGAQQDRVPSVAETIHNGPRDSIDAIEEGALQAVRYWLLQSVEQYLLEASGLQG